jgi:hypothetical protein
MTETAVEETSRAEVPAANNTEKEAAAAAAKEDEPVTSSTDATPSVLPLATNAPSNDNKKIDTLIRVVQATKDGKRYIEGDADWYKMVDQLKEYIKEVIIFVAEIRFNKFKCCRLTFYPPIRFLPFVYLEWRL